MERKKGPWTVTESCERFACEQLTVVEDGIVQPDGTSGTYVFVRSTPGVLVVPVDDAGMAHLVRQYRYAADCETIEAVAGEIDAGETDEEAARRELKEELGITAEELVDLGVVIPVASLLEMREHLYLARGLTFGRPARSATELLTPVTIPFGDALRLAEGGSIESSSTCTLLLRARAHLDG